MTEPKPDEPREGEAQPTFAEAFRAAASRSAIGRGVDGSTSVLAVIGGWLGIVEAILPSLVFLIVYAVTQALWPAVAGALALGVVFLLVRLVRRDAVSGAIGGIVATVFSALVALWSGQDSGYFLTGIWTNVAYGAGLLITAVIGWPAIGVLVGFAMGENVAWRTDRRKRRVFFWLTIMWAGLFVARLAVQVPLYLAGDPFIPALGAAKLAMGIPLFAPLVVVTWLVSRALYRVDPPAAGDPLTEAEARGADPDGAPR